MPLLRQLKMKHWILQIYSFKPIELRYEIGRHRMKKQIIVFVLVRETFLDATIPFQKERK